MTILLVPLGLGLLLVLRMVRTREAGSRRAVSIDMLRLPGQRLMQQISEHQQELTLVLLLLIGGPAYVVGISSVTAAITGKAPSWLLLGPVSVVILAWALWKLRWTTRTLFNLNTGLAAELDAAHYLNQLMRDGYYVFHDLPAAGFNVDHVVVGPKGVFAVETKGRRKPKHGPDGHKVYLTERGLEFPAAVDTRSIDQARSQARWLEQWLTSAIGEPCAVTPALCIPGWYVELRAKPPFPVSNSKTIGSAIIKWNRGTLGEVMIRRIVHQLDQRCRTPYSPLQVPKDSTDSLRRA